MTLDHEAQLALARMAAWKLPSPAEAAASVIRAAENNVRALERGPVAVTVTNHVIDGDVGLTGRLYKPSLTPLALIIFFHGGGWTLGGVAGSDAAVRRLAVGTNCAILSVEYRLAPEHPYPAAIDDAYAAVAWANDHCAGLVGAEGPLVVAGESAGANLAAVVTHQSLVDGRPTIAAQLLFCPCVTGNLDSQFMQSFVPPFLPIAALAWLFDQYVPQAKDRVDPRFAPLDAKDFSRLPPAFIAIAECDILAEQGEEYAAKLREANVPVDRRRYSGTFHGFVELDGGARHSQQAVSDAYEFLKRHL